MGVLKRNRSTASTEYMKKGVVLYRTILYEILKDFGTKKHIKDLKFVKEHLDEDTRAEIEKIEFIVRDKNIVMNLEYPKHFLKHIRKVFYSLLTEFMDNITYVYSSWPTTKHEYEVRLIKTTSAISNLYTIKREYDTLYDITKIKLGKYVSISKMIDEEINLLNGVRNSIRASIKNLDG